MKFFIICASQAQGKQWLSKKRTTDENFNYQYPNSRDVVIASSPEHIRGMRIEHGIFLPYWENGTNDPLGFLQIIHYSCQGANPVILEMLAKLEKEKREKELEPWADAAKVLAKHIDAEVLTMLGIKL